MATALAPTKRFVSEKEIIQEVKNCYGGDKWVRETNELFPPTKYGCINFGYWEYVPDIISLESREKSQTDLYRKVFEFAEINRKAKASILEVGCGRGHGVHLLSAKGYDAYGIDLVDSQIQKCITNYPTLKHKFKQAVSNRTLFQRNTFDYVISVEAAQHFYNFLSFVREGFRILKKNGKIVITTFFFPNENCKKKIKEILPEGIIGIHRTIQIQKAEKFLKEAGFQNIQIVPIGSKVFNGFCKWAVQAMSKKNHTPRWVVAYEQKLLDYYMIKGEKVND